MLTHHDKRSYQEAASDAAARAREKLTGLIERGCTRAAAVIEQVENQIPEDAIVRGRALTFTGSEQGIKLATGDQVGLGGFLVHDHALHQASEKAGVPWRYVQELRGTDWGRDLVAHNLNEILRRSDGRHLVRSVGGEVRGMLSDKFRRLDSRPVLEAFTAAVSRLGAVPIEGYAMATKFTLKALLPRIFEPVPNEVMAFGLALSNSDFGDGALSLRVFMLRLWCTNYAITDEALRQVHLGGRLSDTVEFSDRTMRLDTARSASMIRDITDTELGPDRVGQVCELIRKADEEKLAGPAIRAFLDKHVGKGDSEAIREAFNSADVEMLPPGQTAWRLSNAISWVAGKAEDDGRKLDLMRVAGLALPGHGRLHGEQN